MFGVQRIGLFLLMVGLLVPASAFGRQEGSPPFNDDWNSSGSGLSFPFNTTGNNVNATLQPLEQNTDAIGASVWWFFQAPETGSVTINTLGSDFDTVLHVFTDFQNGFGNFTFVASNDQFDGDQSQVTFEVNAGQCYEVRVGGFMDGSKVSQGNISLQGFVDTPENDDFDNTIGLSLPFNITGTNVNATVQPDEQNLDFTDATVWWTFQEPSSGMVTIDLAGSDFDAILHVYTDFQNGFGNFTLVEEHFFFETQSPVTFPVNAFQFYEIRVDGFNGSGINGPMGQIQMTGSIASVLLGDVNLDGTVNLLDVSPFVTLITSGGFQLEADINGDGVVSLLDVAPFVQVLTGG